MLDRTARCFSIVMLASLVLAPEAIYAGAGDFDATFGTGGIVRMSLGDGAVPLAITQQPDGKIVAAGRVFLGGNLDFFAARFLSDGSLDASFGADGVVTTPIGSGHDIASGVAVQGDGKIVVVGATFQGATNYDVAVVRYLADGSLDSSFGAGGIVVTDFGGGDNRADDVVLQPDGRLVVAGYADVGPGLSFAVLRYDADGGLDATFDLDGVVTTAVGGSAHANAVVLQPDGKIVVSGGFAADTDFDVALARYRPDGSLDAAFGSGGVATVSLGPDAESNGDLLLQSDGKIVVPISTSPDFDVALARLLPNGSLDAAFGSAGIARIESDPEEPVAIASQVDGKLIAVGYAIPGGAGPLRLSIRRVLPDGASDVSFGGGGLVALSTAPESSIAQDVLVQPDGRVVVAGWVSAPLNATEILLARLLPGVACPTAPAAGCRTAATSAFAVSDNPNGNRDKLVWKWTRGESTSALELGDPTGTTDYALCLYAGTTARALIPAGPGWAISAAGFLYRDNAGTADGIRRIVLKESDGDRSTIKISGKGNGLPDVNLPIEAGDFPVVVQLRRSDSTVCWESRFAASDTSKNDVARFKAVAR